MLLDWPSLAQPAPPPFVNFRRERVWSGSFDVVMFRIPVISIPLSHCIPKTMIEQPKIQKIHSICMNPIYMTLCSCGGNTRGQFHVLTDNSFMSITPECDPVLELITYFAAATTCASHTRPKDSSAAFKSWEGSACTEVLLRTFCRLKIVPLSLPDFVEYKRFHITYKTPTAILPNWIQRHERKLILWPK